MPERTTLHQNQPPWLIRLLNGGGAALRELDLGPVPATTAGLIALAQERSGLNDFGGNDFQDPLTRLLDSCYGDADLNLIGRIALRADTLHCLRNRLLIQRDRNLHPEIAREEIRSPVFILGLPRTGTTILHTLLMADPEHRAPLTWEVMEPSPLGDAQKQERVRRAARSLACLRWLAPAFPRLHSVGAELPQECVSVMSLSFMSDQFDTMYNIPSYRAWFFQQDLAPAYAWHRRFLQHLQFGRSARRWILKAPAHMFALPNLLSAYPDARFVQTHRAPLDAITSVSSLITILRGIFSDSVNPVEIGREAMRYWADTLEKFMAERDQLSSDRICDLSYTELRRDPMAAVHRVYEYFGWSLGGAAEARMRRVLAEQPADQVTFHRYEPEQFGLEAGEMANLFAPYCDRFNLPTREGLKSTRGPAQPAAAALDLEYSLAEGANAEANDDDAGRQRPAMIG